MTQIINNEYLLFNINPSDLIRIARKDYIENYYQCSLKIDEFLGDNHYKIKNNHGFNIFSGEEICDNPLLIEQILKTDLFKIAYNTGFEREESCPS